MITFPMIAAKFFKRVTIEQWQQILPYIGFALTFAIFAFFLWRAVRLDKKSAERMANLPIDQSETTKS